MDLAWALLGLAILDIVLMTMVVPRLVLRLLFKSAGQKKYRLRFRKFINALFKDSLVDLAKQPTTPIPTPTVQPQYVPMALAALPSKLSIRPPIRSAGSPTVPQVTQHDGTVGDDNDTDDDSPSEAPKNPVHAANGADGGNESGRRRSEIAMRVELATTLIREVVPIIPEAAARKMARTAIKYPDLAAGVLVNYAARRGVQLDPAPIIEFLSTPLDEQNLPLVAEGA